MDLEKISKGVNPREGKKNRNTSDEKQLIDDEERKKIKRDGQKKIFCHRNSVLTDMMKVNHFQTIHNINVALFILLVIFVGLFYMATPREFWADLGFLMNDLSKMYVALIVWIGLILSCAIVYCVFKWWTLQSIQHKKKNGILYHILPLVYVMYLVSTFAVPAFCVVKFQVGKHITLALLCEQCRITMKIYSFIRENVPRILKANSHKGEKIEIKSLCPNFQHFVYYLFVPTLIYRDTYPRTSTIRWRFVIKNLLEFAACLIVFYCIIYLFCLKAFRNVCRVKFTPSDLLLTMAGSIAAGIPLILILFYSIMHCLPNAFAEMLRFGDRLFYQDWWNSTSIPEFNRKWNFIVSDWLRTYVYMELQEMGWSRNTTLHITFLLSCFVHESILGFTFGTCIHIYNLLYYAIGVSEVYFKMRGNPELLNIFLYLAGCLYIGVCIFLYNVEMFARFNSSTALNKPLDYFVPRFLTSNVLSLQ